MATIGIPKEIKNNEFRVGLTPEGTRRLSEQGHKVFIQSQAGKAVGFNDADYQKAGAEICKSAEDVFAKAELIVKIKEPQTSEFTLITAKHTLFTYLHLAPDENLTNALLASGATAIAYETVSDDNGKLPLLTPMSEIAGSLASQVGAHYLEKAQGGRGILLAGTTNVAPGKVLVLGAGIVGINAARIALGLGAQVTLVDRSDQALSHAQKLLGAPLKVFNNTNNSIDSLTAEADLIVSAVLIPGGRAPQLLKRHHLKSMQEGSVVVDVAIDQGGCFETSHPTTHQDPVYTEEGITHYCVSNMPSAAALTATLALTDKTLPFIEQLASLGTEKALLANKHLRNGLNIYQGTISNKAVAQAQGKPFDDCQF